MESMEEQLLRAVGMGEAGDWDAAHDIAQRHEGEALADWIHALLHKIEGEVSNSRYWYARAHRPEWFAREAAAEWREIRRCVENGRGGHGQ
jgi:hypothetical protein